MKLHSLAAGLLLASTFTSPARTWTSADGKRIFEGDLQHYDASTGKVTMLIDGQSVDFLKDKLSAEDITFLTESLEEAVEVESQKAETQAAPTAIADLLASDQLSVLAEGKFANGKITKTPKYYLLYFSASW